MIGLDYHIPTEEEVLDDFRHLSHGQRQEVIRFMKLVGRVPDQMLHAFADDIGNDLNAIHRGLDRKSSKFSDTKSVTELNSKSNPAKLGATAKKIAEEYNIGYGTVLDAEHFAKGIDSADSVSSGFREDLLFGKVKATKGEIQALRNLDGDELKDAVEELKKPKAERQRSVAVMTAR